MSEWTNMPTTKTTPKEPTKPTIAAALSAGGLWAIDPKRIPTIARAQASAADHGQQPVAYTMAGDMAVIPIRGVLVKQADIWTRLFGGTSTLEVEQALQASIDDPDVAGIVLSIDSPGGQVSGTEALGNAIAACPKPIIAQVSDTCASGAYWLASQCDKVYANQTALIGSIGVFAVVPDYSKMFEDAGVKVNVIKAGEFKGAGTIGAPVTDKELAAEQQVIDDLYGLFVGTVAKGRGMSVQQVQAFADGRVFVAAQAAELGLIDGIQDMAATIAGMRNPIAAVVPVAAIATRPAAVAVQPTAAPAVPAIPVEPADPIEAEWLAMSAGQRAKFDGKEQFCIYRRWQDRQAQPAEIPAGVRDRDIAATMVVSQQWDARASQGPQTCVDPLSADDEAMYGAEWDAMPEDNRRSLCCTRQGYILARRWQGRQGQQ